MSTFGMCQAWKSGASNSELGGSRKWLHVCAILSQSSITGARVAVHVQIKSSLGSEYLQVSAVAGVKAQTCINNSAPDKGILPVQKEKLTASSEKTCSVSILGADFWSDSVTQHAWNRSQICVYKWIVYGRQTCGDFSLY